MTSIFATALNAIKTNPRRSSGAPTSKPKEVHRQDDSDKSGSILDRIKLKKPAGKTIKKIELHREDSSDEERFKVIHKVIKKDKNIELNRPMVKKGDIDGQWKHDKYDGPTISSSTSLVTVFVRNLPDSVDKDSLMYLCREYDSVIGIKIDSGTAEINFSQKDQARKASEALNGKVFRGSKLKAAIMSEINTGPGRVQSGKMRDEGPRKKEEEVFQKKTHMDSVGNEGKTSILNRIKKSY